MQEQNLYQAQLLDRYIKGLASPEETAELFAWLRKNSPESIGRLKEIMEQHYTEAFSRPEGLSSSKSRQILTSILSQTDKIKPKKPIAIWYRVAATVTIILALGTALYFIFSRGSRPSVSLSQTLANVQAPQSSHAIITLANGTHVSLDSAANGQLALQGNVKLVKLNSGQIAYQDASAKTGSKQPVYNTLTNPRGSQVINMILSDGSHVWLNAGSSITYPVAFVHQERRVSITGEVYFDVAQQVNKPFYVTKGDLEVKVLGTHFNVNAYEEEDPASVTLLEGAVNVSSLQYEVSQILKPGEQATVKKGVIKLNKAANIEQVMAWKNGLFDFEGMGIKEAALQLECWYDIRIEYDPGMPDVPLFGKIDRNLSLADILDILKGAGFEFRMEKDRTLVLEQSTT